MSFKAGFAIHDARHYQGLLGESSPIKTDVEKNFMEIYFESEVLNVIQDKLKSMNSKFVHNIR